MDWFPKWLVASFPLCLGREGDHTRGRLCAVVGVIGSVRGDIGVNVRQDKTRGEAHRSGLSTGARGGVAAETEIGCTSERDDIPLIILFGGKGRSTWHLL